MSNDKSEGQVAQQLRTWRVDALVLAPMLTSSVPPLAGEQLKFQSRLVPKLVTYNNSSVALLPAAAVEGEEPSNGLDTPLGQEWAHLIVDVPEVPTANDALEKAIEVLEPIIDEVSFVLGSALRLGPFRAIDITPPVNVGDAREVHTYSGPPYGTNISSVEMESIRGAQLVTLPEEIPEYDVKVAAALRWYYKAQTTPLLHDQFIFLWIALENLTDLAPLAIKGPYQAPCNHSIKHCPECGRSTDKEIRGPTIRHYLEVSFGVSPAISGALWRMRQMMHGAINFDPAKLQDLPTLIQPLRAAVADGIKRHTGKRNYDAPHVLSEGLSINQHLGASGTGPISGRDVATLADKITAYETKLRENAAAQRLRAGNSEPTEEASP